MKRLVCLLALLAFPAHAARVVVCDAANGRVLRYDPSANTPEYAGNREAVINPPALATLAAVPVHHWACIGTAGAWTDVREMTAPEKAALATQQAAADTASARSGACLEFDGKAGLAMRAIVRLMLDEINTLRALHALPPRTMAQAKTAVCNAINGGTIDE